MKKILLITLFLCVNGLYAFDNQAQINTFDNIMQDNQALQKAKSLCMQDKLWIEASGNEAHFANACYAVASKNLIRNSLGGSDDIELKEDLELIKKACSITIPKADGCTIFISVANFIKKRLNLSDDYVSEDLKQRSFEYLSRACDKEYSIFQSKAKNKNSINGFYDGKTCDWLESAYLSGIGTLKDNEKATFYEKRAAEIQRGVK